MTKHSATATAVAAKDLTKDEEFMSALVIRDYGV
jgi:hypothetical protein